MRKLFLGLLILVVMAGCASKSKKDQETELMPGYEAPSTVKEALQRGDNAYASANKEKALFEYTQGLDLKGNKSGLYYRIGRIHAEMQKYPLAALAYEKSIKEDPTLIAAHENLGLMDLQLKQHDKASSAFTQAIALDQARLSKNKSTVTADESALLKANLQVDGTSPFWAYNGMGLLNDLKKNFSASEKYFQLAIKISPASPEGYNNAAYSCYLAGQWDCAEKSFKRAIEARTDFAPAWRNLGMLYVRKGELGKAEQAFNKVEKNYETYNDMGYVLMLISNRELARTYFNKSIEAAPFYYKPAYENMKVLNAR